MTKKSYVITDFDSFATDIRKAVADALVHSKFPDGENTTIDLDSYMTIYQVKEIIRNNALEVTDDDCPVVDLKGMDNAWTQIDTGLYNATLSKLAASGHIECGWDDETNNMAFWPKEKKEEK